MTYFAGLDVSLEETTICIVDESGRIMKEMRAASEPQALAEALRKVDLPLERVGLGAEGWPAICIETRQANAAMKTMPNKTDRNDARALAQIMRTGWFRQVHVKSRQCRLWRSLLVARRTVLNEMRSIENVVRALLREAGVKLGLPSRTAFAGRVRELAGADAEVIAMFEPLLVILAAHAEGVRPADQASSRHRPQGGGLPAADERAGRRADHRARLPRHHRPAGAVRFEPGGGRASRADAVALPVRRDRHSGKDQPLRRRTGAHGAL